MTVIWRILLGISLVFLGFAAGAWVGGHFFVQAGAGLAGGAEVLGYGLAGAIGTLVLGMLAGFFRSQGKRLRTIAIVLTLIAIAVFVLLGMQAFEREDARQAHQPALTPTRVVTGDAVRSQQRDANLVDTPKTDVSVLRAQNCAPTPERHAMSVAGSVAGERAFTQPVGPDWIFMLRPSPYGWDVRLRDRDGLDLSQITPPYRLAPNPRELYGWHFRNAANTGPNTGDVNAPQHLRAFQFSPSLTGTGGFRPSAPFAAPDETQGRGTLTIVDMGLSDPEPGAKARMNYLEFIACLTWPKTAEEIRDDA